MSKHLDMNIRPATPEDADTIARLEREFVDFLISVGDENPASIDADTYLKDGFGKSPAFSGIVAEINGEVVGHLLYHPGYDIDHGGRVLYVLELFVTESAREKGIGTALMKKAAEICREAGGNKLIWGVFNPNEKAFAFYESLGARRLSNMTYMHWKIKDS